jgi:HK97 family phage prohead protease
VDVIDLREAAAARRSAVRAPADRPSQRRSTANVARTPYVRTPLTATGGTGPFCRMSIRGGAEPTEPLIFEGFASITDKAYEMYDMFGPYEEIVHVGAFTETLSKNPDVPLVISHNQERRIARTGNAESPLLLSEVVDGDETGLKVFAPSLPLELTDVVEVTKRISLGLIDEMSFAFTITAGRWNESYDEFHISVVDIHRGDVSIVGYGANPYTSAGVREQSSGVDSDSLRAMLLGIV